LGYGWQWVLILQVVFFFQFNLLNFCKHKHLP